jgi:hypothetical protein
MISKMQQLAAIDHAGGPTRRQRVGGQASIETLAGFIVLIPVFMVLFDLVIIFIGYQQNAAVCRDAARAASIAQPASGDASGVVGSGSPIFQRAKTIVDNVKSDGSKGYFTGPTIKEVRLADYTAPGAFGGAYTGNVLVTTTIDIRLPVAIPNLTPETVTFDTTSSFPMTGTVQSTVTPP